MKKFLLSTLTALTVLAALSVPLPATAGLQGCPNQYAPTSFNYFGPPDAAGNRLVQVDPNDFDYRSVGRITISHSSGYRFSGDLGAWGFFSQVLPRGSITIQVGDNNKCGGVVRYVTTYSGGM